MTKSLFQNHPPREGQAHFAANTPHDHRGDGARPVPGGFETASSDDQCSSAIRFLVRFEKLAVLSLFRRRFGQTQLAVVSF
jgi:hypothetical protein